LRTKAADNKKTLWTKDSEHFHDKNVLGAMSSTWLHECHMNANDNSHLCSH
jgi:hypothetical protein